MNPFLLAVLIAGVAGLAYHAFKTERGSPVSGFSTARVNASDARQYRKEVPLAGTCGMCKEKVSMPFRCSYCKRIFCERHRLPEDHECDGL